MNTFDTSVTIGLAIQTSLAAVMTAELIHMQQKDKIQITQHETYIT